MRYRPLNQKTKVLQITAVAPKHIYEDTSAVLECGGTSFTAKGRVVTSAGFKKLEQAFFSTLKKKPEDDTKEDAGALPPLTDGQTFEKVKASAKEGTTSPPKHFTQEREADYVSTGSDYQSKEPTVLYVDAQITPPMVMICETGVILLLGLAIGTAGITVLRKKPHEIFDELS